MHSEDMPAALQGSFVSLKTMADGTVRVVLELGNSTLAEVGAIGLAPGVPIVLARMTPMAALQQAQQATAAVAGDAGAEECAREPGSGASRDGAYGHYYRALYGACNTSWFNSGDVRAKLGRDEEEIKANLYQLFSVTSLREVSPHDFAAEMRRQGVYHTLPRALKVLG